MDNLVPLMLSLLLTCMIQAEVRLEPGTLTVLRGEEARYTCSTSEQWTVMVWMVNGASVLTVSREHGALPSNNPNVKAENHSTPKRASWLFVLSNTERSHQGQVTCDLQNVQQKTATLFVQERGSVEVSGGNRTALRGQWLLFECQAEGWFPYPRLAWLLNDIEVDQGEYNVSSEVSADGLFSVNSSLSVHAAESSHVECLASVSALHQPLTSGVRLTVVAEVLQDGEGDDCTVLLALTATLAAIVLLLLLCLCIVLLQRLTGQSKSSQIEAIRFNQSVSGRRSVAEETVGNVNLGYSVEALTDAGYNELIRVTYSQTDSVSTHKAPDVVSSSNLSLHSQSQAQVDLREEISKTVRRVTTV